jgi:hypothetical protein|tara:strand:- start:254 stop:490 length:237 start_codon:yes stop_codon:yes gene_type:complete
MKVGDLVRYTLDLQRFHGSAAHYDHLKGKVYYVIEDIVDYGVNGKGQTYFLLGWNEPDTHGRRMKFFQSQLEVISEGR